MAKSSGEEEAAVERIYRTGRATLPFADIRLSAAKGGSAIMCCSWLDAPCPHHPRFRPALVAL